MSISKKTRKMLWSRAAGRCAFPECRYRELVMDASPTDDESIVGDECHIVAKSPTGPRGESPLTSKQRDHYDNLILLCRVHHKLVDDQPNTYTVQRLLGMKAAHEEWVRETLQGFGPPIWNLPHPRNPNFTGRETLLSALQKALTSGQPAALTQAITGLGGIGKTQLALEHTYRHKADYTLVWWIRAEQPASLAADYAALAVPLDLPQKDDPDQRLIVQAVRHWLGQHTGWLLIFDNVPGPAQIRDYLPHGATGHIIVTSRNPHWREVATPLTVQKLKRPESVAFLQKRTGQTDEAAADALADALGDLPLALAQAGAYIEENKGTTFADYLDLFQSRRELWEDEHPPLDYPHTVATTWSLAMDRVREESPTGADLLNLCAFLGPDDIPRDLLSEGAAHLPEPMAATVTDLRTMNQATKPLHRYSLLEVTEGAFSLHRLVQAVARDRLAEEARRTWAEAAVQIVNDALPFGVTSDMQTWPVYARLLPHALAAAEHAAELKVASEATGRLLNQVGLYLDGRAELAEAKAAYERALAIGEATLGPDHPNVAIRVNNLGSVLQDLGDLAGARAAFERALAIDEAAFGPHHPNVAIRVNNLGLVLQDLGDLAEARAAFERALAIDEAVFGPDHPNVAIRVNNLGGVLKDLGDLVGAREAFERALAIDEAAFGPHHPNVARDVNNLGNVLQALGDLAGARAAYERALAIDEAAFGPHHPNVATDVNNLGSVLQDLGDLAGTLAAYERALAIFEKVLGADHPNVATLVNNLGLVLQALGDLAGARAAYERALAIDEAAFGPDHPNVARDVNNLGMVLQDLGDLAGARAAYERALAIDEAVFGPDHPNVAIRVNNLGLVLKDLGDLAGARAAYERALQVFRQFLGEDHPHTVRVRNNLASLDV